MGADRKGDTVYFKDSGEPVKIKATVSKVLQFANLTPKKVRELLEKYGSDDGISKEDVESYFKKFKDKKYCLLIFIKDVERIEPFEIRKEGFGNMASWLTVANIEKIKKVVI